MANLLDRASVVLTPTAYNNGEALCIKPDDGSGDFDFSRNSAATRVNAQGLVENVQILSSNLVQNGDFSEEGAEEVSNGNFSQEGSELVTNGGFATDTDWTKQTSWSISGGSANYDFLSDAKYIRQTLLNGGFVSGKTYKINFEITSGTAYMNVNSNGGGLISLNTYSVGSYSIYVTASASGSDLLIYGRNTSGTAFSIDNVSVREVGQDWNLGTGWSIGEDKAIATSTANSISIYQNNTVEVGKTYKVTYTVADYVEGGIYVRVGSGVNGVVRFGNGTYTEYITQAGDNKLYLTTYTTTTLSITNISVKEVGQNWTLGSGWSIGDGVAIFDYDTSISKIFTSNLNLNLNNSYKLSFEIKNVLSGTPNIFIANSGGSVGYNGNYTNYSEGVHTLIFSPSSNQTTLSFFARYSDFSITNISVIEITDDTNLPRINYEGFSYQDALGSELVTNGDFSDGSTGWNTLGNATTSSGYGELTFDGSTGNQFYQGTLTSGKTYKVQYEVLSNTSTDGKVFSNAFSNGGIRVDVSVGTHYFVLEAINTTFFNFRTLSGTGGLVQIDNVSVKEYLGQEVVPDSGCGSWLWEPQTTQLVPYSEDFSQSSWSKGSDISIESGYLAPDGNNTAYKVSEIGAATSYLTNNIGLTSTSTRSVYARSVSGTRTATLLSHNSNTNNVFTLTEQWQRFELNNTASPSGLSTFYAADFRGSGTLTEYLVWGANATNDQDYATSYIPSNGSTVTRNQDVCNNGGSLASINSTEGVLYAEIARSEEENLYRLLGIDDGTSNNYVKMGFENSRGAFWIRAVINGVTSISSDNALTSNPNEFYKIAIRYQSGNSAIYINGTSVLTTTTTFSSGNFTALDFNHWNNSLNFFGKTKAVAVWKEALSDQELTN